jgi:16S rRNA (guanine1516-N2)-methyltransferase
LKKLGIYPTVDALYAAASAIAIRYQLPLLTELPTQEPYILQLSTDGLAIYDVTRQLGNVSVDFISARSEYRRLHGGGKNQLLARAIGLKHQTHLKVLDMTAGLGRDAFVLASLGCEVHMIERSPVLAALLADALQRAASVDSVQSIIQRMQLTYTQAATYLTEASVMPDVIYFDPMYPHRQKSALVKKEMRILRTLVGDDEDAAELIGHAMKLAKLRVVVKRPKGAPLLGSIPPTFDLSSESTRFDVYVTKK